MSETGAGSEGPVEKVSLKDAADHAISTITFDTARHWDASDLAAEAEARGLVPPVVYARARRRAVVDWLTTFGRAVKLRVDVHGEAQEVRKFGVYVQYLRVEDGLVKRLCWREWAMMGRKEAKTALRELFKIARAAEREALGMLEYVNGLLQGKELRPLSLGEVQPPQDGVE